LETSSKSLDLMNGQLTVSAESKVSSEQNENGYAVQEHRYSKFAQTLQLPKDVKDKKIKASMDNGVLTVTFLKTGAEAALQKITIA
ncbi:HSP20-like chaperone, partial [Cyathus striatus]